MTYMVIDWETTILESYKRKANPLDRRNKIVVAAHRVSTMPPDEVVIEYNPKGVKVDLPFEGVETLVGQNFKFDLLYIWDDPALQEWIRKGGKVFDTMVAEYLLTAQQHTYASLNSLATKYGGTLKDDLVKEYIEADIGPELIPPKVLLPYAKEDILNTELVYQKQLEALKREGLLPLFEGYMDHYLALIEMEYNGLYVDREELDALERLEQAIIDQLLEALRKEISNEWTFDMPFNPDSVEHVSAVLFGTTVTIDIRVPTLDENGNEQYFGPNAAKAGELKTHKSTMELMIPWRHRPKDVPKLQRKKPVYSSDISVLKRLAKDPFIDLLLEYREHKKLLTTYIHGTRGNTETGLKPLIYATDSCIHHTLDCVATKTGRLNGRNPNMQNLPKAIQPVFSSRFGENGKIVIFDYSQLEVVVQAYLSQSETMIRHIAEGVDFHCKRLAYAEELSYEQVIKNLKTNPGVWGEKRRNAKTVSFQKAYGAQPSKIADETGLPVETVERIFKAEDEEYPEIGNFNQDVMNSAQQTRVPNGESLLQIRDKDRGTYDTRPTEAEGIGYWRSVTGKRYHFIEKGVTSAKLRERGNDPFRYFKSPEIANYPVQGTAADIVALSVGRIYRHLKATERLSSMPHGCRLINEVHDSLIIDWDGTNSHIIEDIRILLEDVPATLKHYLGLDFNVTIAVDCKVSNNWGGIEDE